MLLELPGWLPLEAPASPGIPAAPLLQPFNITGWEGIIGLLMGVLVSYLIFKISGRVRLQERFTRKNRGQSAGRKQTEQERLQAIYGLISTLTTSLNYQRILNSVLDLSSSILESSDASAGRLVGAVWLFTQKQGQPAELTIGSARHYTPADMRVVLPGVSGLIGRAIENAEPTISKSFLQDSELARVVAMRNCKVAYCIPLRAGLETYGVLLYGHPDAEYFTKDRRETLEVISNQAVVAIQNAKLYRDLEQEKERMLEIQEEARKKLARDLHDGPTQSVAAIAMRVNFARRLMSRDAEAASNEMVKIEELARRTTKEIRHMLFTLRPLVLESQGLIAALEAMAEKMRDTYNQNVIISADPDIIPELEMNKQTVVFYIAEEAVNNVRKHAQAANTWVRLKSMEKDLVLLEIEDNGVGFNVGAMDAYYEQRGSLGMVNMRERAELVNGVLRIDSAEGHGTRIRALIPLTEEAAEKLHSVQV
jgi:signal transduction histidine kinase